MLECQLVDVSTLGEMRNMSNVDDYCFDMKNNPIIEAMDVFVVISSLSPDALCVCACACARVRTRAQFINNAEISSMFLALIWFIVSLKFWLSS